MAAATLWRGRSSGWKVGVIALSTLLVCGLLVVAALLTEVQSPEHEARVARENQPTLPAPDPVLAGLSPNAPVPDEAALARALEPLATAPSVGELTGVVIDNDTGRPLWQRDPSRPRTPASTTKLLTGLAAHLVVPADARLRTTLAEGADGTLVVVPGGDITTAAQDTSTAFPGADTLEQFVQLARGSDTKFTGVTIAPGPYEGTDMAPGWNEADIPGGFLTRVQPWMLDGGRVDPEKDESPREGQPMYAAALALAAKLGFGADKVRVAGDPVPVRREIGAVPSGTLNQRSRAITDQSDNVGADALCHEVAMHRTGIADAPAVTADRAGWSDPGARVSIAESVDAVLATLRDAGVDLSGTSLSDCSGMSAENRISPNTLASVLHVAARPDATPQARALLDTLPIAAGTGTLGDRFAVGSPEAAGAGWIRAKTGTLTGVSTLAGVVTTRDGRSLSFALMSGGTNPADARPGLDRIAAALRGCGCR